MLPGLRAFLEGILDYAGLFPPARLSMNDAVSAYLRARGDSVGWMVSRFICPVTRFAELETFADRFREIQPAFPVAALGRGGESAIDFLVGMRADLSGIMGFHSRQQPRATVDAFEVRLPVEVVTTSSKDGILKLLAQCVDMLAENVEQVRSSFYEVPAVTGWKEACSRVIGDLAEVNRRGGTAGLKLRCGGLDASAFPSVEQVAFVLGRCRDAGVPLKFTAGLHHPVRRYDPGVKTHMHGFFNVFAAGMLAHVHRLDDQRLREVLADEDARSFTFGVDGFRWRDLAVSLDEIRRLRREAVLSFGSCSFDEPREDLQALGLVERP